MLGPMPAGDRPDRMHRGWVGSETLALGVVPGISWADMTRVLGAKSPVVQLHSGANYQCSNSR